MQKLPAVSAFSSAAFAALGLAGCMAASPPGTDPSGGDPPPPGPLDLDIHRTATPVAGSAFECTGTWPSSLTPCGYAWSSQPTTSELSADGVVHLTLRRSPMPVDGGASMVFVDLQFNSAAMAGAKAWESTTHFGTAQQSETSRPISGWIDPFVTGVTPGSRNAGQFSLTFAWGSIKGSYDTSP